MTESKFAIICLLPTVMGLPPMSLGAKRIDGLSWDLENNCGPRPTGPMWPHPPINTNYNPQSPMHCDMLEDDLYAEGYKCNTTCQAAPEKQIEVHCDCLRSFMGITLPKPCEWVTKTIDGEKTECPSVPDTMPSFDWQCDPRIETCAKGQYGEPIVVEFIGELEDDEEEEEKEEEETEEKKIDEVDEIDAAEEAIKTVEMFTELVEKEQEFIKNANVMKKQYEKALEDQYVESVMAEFIPGYTKAPTAKPNAYIIARYNPDSIFGDGPSSSIIGGDDIFTTKSTTTSTVTSTMTTATVTTTTRTTTTTTTSTTTSTTTAETTTSTRSSTTVTTETQTTMATRTSTTANTTDMKTLHHTSTTQRIQVSTPNALTPAMMYDFVALDDEEEIVEVNTKSETLRYYTQNDAILAKQLETAESMVKGSNGIIINTYNNQVYNQHAMDEARLVNNHHQDLTFGDKL